MTTSAGVPVAHVISLEYRLNIYGEYLVNPEIGVHVRVTAQVQSPDRSRLIHSAAWTYCGDRFDFVSMGAYDAAAFRRQIDIAATVLAEAIPYDLYVSNEPRRLSVRGVCMDFSNLPSRVGGLPVSSSLPAPPPRTPPQPAPTTTQPAAAAAAPAAPVQAASAAPVASPPTMFDGNWQIEMEQLSTTYGTTVGGECPARHSFGVTFVNGVAEWPRGKLTLTAGGEISGWTNVPAAGTSMLPFIVNLSGGMDNTAAKVVKGTVAGRCTGSFTMRRQSSGSSASAAQVASAAPVVPSPPTLDGNWKLEMQLDTAALGVLCSPRYEVVVAAANGNAEWPRGRVQMTGQGEISGWVDVPPAHRSTLPYIVNLSGRIENGMMTGTVTGRCSGTFTMRKQ